jgi:hypothetical protein
MGFVRGNLPAGLQILGRPWSEPVLIRIGYSYEQATGTGIRRRAPRHCPDPLPTSGFVPGSQDQGPLPPSIACTLASKPKPNLARNRKFESSSPQRRVCELLVPKRWSPNCRSALTRDRQCPRGPSRDLARQMADTRTMLTAPGRCSAPTMASSGTPVIAGSRGLSGGCARIQLGWRAFLR